MAQHLGRLDQGVQVNTWPFDFHHPALRLLSRQRLGGSAWELVGAEQAKMG
jgi:hypothetical protein